MAGSVESARSHSAHDNRPRFLNIQRAEGMDLEKESGQEESVPRIIRLVRPSVAVFCGPAACGKSTFAAHHFRPTQIISSDRARALVCDDERDQRFQTQTFALVHFLIDQRLSVNRLCVVDSTALTPASRKSLLELARAHRVPCVALLFEVSLEKCIERDQARERSVGRQVIERQYEFYEQARSSIHQEGFDQIYIIREEDLVKARVEILFRPLPHPAGMPSPPERRRSAPRFAPDRRGGQESNRGLRPHAQEHGTAPRPPSSQGHAGADVGDAPQSAALPDSSAPQSEGQEKP